MNVNYYQNTSRYYKNVDIVSLNINNNTMAFPLQLNSVKFTDNDIQMYYNVGTNEEARMDLIASKVYGNSALWWPIAIANQIEDLLTEPIAGTTLKIPSMTAIQKYV